MVEKKSLKDRWNGVVEFCKENKTLIIEVVCTVISAAATCGKIYADAKEYKETIIIQNTDGQDYKVKCKRMNTAAQTCN